MSSLTSSRTGLLDLPNELLLMIKNSLDPHDLVSNVCYYLLCKRTAACYDKHSDADWMRLLRANGLGLGTYELLGESGHKLMAMECARHAWMCTHPQCGRARLQENRKLSACCLITENATMPPTGYSMQAAIEAWPSLNYEGTVKSPHFDVPPDEGPIVPSTLFAYIAFKNKRLGPLDGPLLSDPAYLRPVDQDIKQPPPEETLDDHPIVRRTFACFPPIDAMDVDSPFEVVRMQNRRGLITKDVCYFLGIQWVPDSKTYLTL